jgi:hypothetical protein
MKLDFTLKCETRTCFRFEHKNDDNFVTLYLKKTQVKDAGIDPNKGIAVTIEQKED